MMPTRILCIGLFGVLGNILAIGQNNCSFNLVTGPDGVPDDYLSASSTNYNLSIFSPKEGRLHSGYCWEPELTPNQYIQVRFDHTKQIMAVQTQGCKKLAYHAKSYAVSYSLDNNKWTFLMDNDAVASFHGNSDQNTIVTNVLPEVVEAKYFRIYPKTWTRSHCGLRFELIGCSSNLSTKSWKVHPIQITDLQNSLWNNSASDLGECAILCFNKTLCKSFIFNGALRTCTGFQQNFLYGNRLDMLQDNLYFLRTESWDQYLVYLKYHGYTVADDVIYKIYQQQMNITSAKRVCKNDRSHLLLLRKRAVLYDLQAIIGHSMNISTFNLFVDGSEMNHRWVYNNDIEIPSFLWKNGEPLAGISGCVVVTETGLKVASCSTKRPFICGF